MADPVKAIAERLKSAQLGDRLVRRLPLLYHSFRRELAEFEAAGPEQRRHLQARLTERTLRSAGRLAAYRGVDLSDLRNVPLLTKESLRERGMADFSRAGLLVTRAQTSGSSGIPLELARSFSSVVFEQAAIDHIVAQAGGDFARDRVAVLRGDMIKSADDFTPPYWRMQSGGRVLKGSSAHLNQKTLPDYHKALQDFAPGILWAYPSVLELLLSCLEQRDLTLDIPIVLTSSEVLTGDVRARAEKRLNATVIDYYGQAERVCFASDPDGAGYRFLGPYGAVELMATEDPQRKEIVATNLRNNAMILLRYRTGDIAVLDAQPTREHLEEIALGLRPFGRIDGREGDYLLAPDGSRIIGMNHVPRGIEGVLQMQIHQTSASDVAVHAIAGTTDTASLRTAIETAMRPRMPADMTLTVAFRDRLTRTSAGKLPFIVRTIGSSDN